jgi:hypothetical protein
LDENGEIQITVVVLNFDDVHLNAILGLCSTSFVIAILVIGAIMFSKDGNDYVVIPIENMLSKVRRIA